MVGDRHGHVVALASSECTRGPEAGGGIEEAPPPGLGARVVRATCDAAIRVAEAAEYVGVGTVRFALGGGMPHFIELRAELPAGHAVTEAVTGLDLVELQIRVARGASLRGLQPTARGVAIGACVCSSPLGTGVPARVARFEPALGVGIRIDSGTTVGASVEPGSSIVRLVATGDTRAETSGRLQAALESTEVIVEHGGTNQAHLVAALRSLRSTPEPEAVAEVRGDAAPEALAAAALLLYRQERESERHRLFREGTVSPAMVPPPCGRSVDLTINGLCHSIDVAEVAPARYRASLDGRSMVVSWEAADAHSGRLLASDRAFRVLHYSTPSSLWVEVDGTAYQFGLQDVGELRAALPALVTAVHVDVGRVVEEGDAIAVLEAMKTEMVLRAPVAGTVTHVDVIPGRQVSPGNRVARIEPGRTGAEGARRQRLRNHREDRRTLLGLRREIRNVLLGFEVEPAVTADILERLNVMGDARSSTGAAVAVLCEEVTLFADLEVLFSRALRFDDDAGRNHVSNAERLWRSVADLASGREVTGGFEGPLQIALRHYGLKRLEPGPGLEHALLRLLATAHSRARRCEMVEAVLHRLARVGSSHPALRRNDHLKGALSRVAELRELVGDALADQACELTHLLYEAPQLRRRAKIAAPPSDGTWLQEHLARLDAFVLTRLPTVAPVHCFHGQARDVVADRRVLVFTRVTGAAAPDGGPSRALVAAIELALGSSTRALRRALDEQGSNARVVRRMLTVDVEPVLALDAAATDRLVGAIAPTTRRRGIESVTLRIRSREHRGARELVVRTRVGFGVVSTWNDAADRPIDAAGPYEQRLAVAHRRGLPDPYEVVRLLEGDFQELGVRTDGPAVLRPVGRRPGGNECSVVVGLRASATAKVPEGLERVLIVSDPSHAMGAITPSECRRIVAALDLAEERGLPVEWAPISSGARIAMDSGTENLDATAVVVKRIVRFTQAGGVIHIIVSGVNVGGQSYWDALSTMLPHTKGALVMTPAGSMVLTGRAALGASGSVAAEDEIAIGGFERMAGPNGQAQYCVPDLQAGFRLLDELYRYSYVVPGETSPRRHRTTDPDDRDVTVFPYAGPRTDGFQAVGEIFDDVANPGRKRPFSMRAVMDAVIDQDGGRLERWRDWRGAETAIVWDAHLGGVPVCLLGIEGKSVPRDGARPADGPTEWSGGTLFPNASRKIARALNIASGNRPVVVLAHLAGFDGSPESLRCLQLENGAEIARAVVNFEGPIVFLVVSRYHGGAYVVFSRELNPSVRVAALHGSYASVIGGNAAATVVFTREAQRRARADPEVVRLSQALGASGSRVDLDRAIESARVRAERGIAAEFDAAHTIERAQEVGSIGDLVLPTAMRPYLTGVLKAALCEEPGPGAERRDVLCAPSGRALE
ncbi:MAG: carboxyl transferase domain-containing protein [Candidatus Binatia bacterium]|nr:carboxyl transferase domain-containing protein [Candidatus Binatia bacterium]